MRLDEHGAMGVEEYGEIGEGAVREARTKLEEVERVE